jgi:hypothetical protein
MVFSDIPESSFRRSEPRRGEAIDSKARSDDMPELLDS